MTIRNKMLFTMGVQCWLRREPGTGLPVPSVLQENAEIHNHLNYDIPDSSWEGLENSVINCQSCPLHKTRLQTVFGVGDKNAEWMIVGEAPGAEEDRQGKPFVGRAGKLLNSILFAAGLRRENVFIANILKCRPPNNRDPIKQEIDKCEPFLIQQLKLVKPKIILALGRVAAQNLLKTDTSIGQLRGGNYFYNGCPLVVTYHPAYLLRSPQAKKQTWEDIKMAMTRIGHKQ